MINENAEATPSDDDGSDDEMEDIQPKKKNINAQR